MIVYSHIFLRRIFASVLVITFTASFLPVATPLVSAQTGGIAPFTTNQSCSTAASFQAVPTYESLGLYLDVGAGEALVRFRVAGQSQWRAGFPLHYDGRTSPLILQNNGGARQRGSLVHLNPNTNYEVQVLHNNRLYCGTFRTKNDQYPIAQTIDIGNQNNGYRITRSGTPNGYILYTGGTIRGSAPDYNIVVDANYVIVRGMKLEGGNRGGIHIAPGRHNVVIEDNEITGFGRIAPDAGREGPRSRFWGYHMAAGDAGIRPDTGTHNLTIQRNHIHTPRTDTNTWGEFRNYGDGLRRCVDNNASRCHPYGPGGIVATHNRQPQRGQNVIRYNTITGTPEHMFEDTISGRNNDWEFQGFPGPDSDVYGNYLAGATDDLVELEGIGRNSRFWGNHIHNFFGDNNPGQIGPPPQASTGSHIAISPVTVGPLYIWRNLMTNAPDASKVFTIKHQSRDNVTLNGRVFLFHNTAAGGRNGNGWSSSNTTLRGAVALNNIMHVRGRAFEAGGEDVFFDYNLYTGSSPQQPNGLMTTPQLDANYIVRPNTAGFNAGIRIPNFNDNYAGSAPDMGFQEAGGQPLRVGHTGRPLQVTGGGSGAVDTVSIPGTVSDTSSSGFTPTPTQPTTAGPTPTQSTTQPTQSTTAQPAPASIATPLPARPPIVAGSAIGKTFVTFERLNIRAAAGTSAAVLGVADRFTAGIIQSEPVSANGFTWYRVHFFRGDIGWVAGEYVFIMEDHIASIPGAARTPLR